MKYLNEFRQKELVDKLTKGIGHLMADIGRKVTLMEVCGTHTMAAFRYGIKDLLPANLHLLSGPGCPVCVTANDYLDRAIAYARKEGVIVATFGDMVKVPGSSSSLAEEASNGAEIRVVYSSLEALKIAQENREKKVIFLGIGFETTAPTVASSILTAGEDKLSNYFVLSGHKIMPPIMRTLAQDHELKIDGFICPGHVSSITGSKIYEFLSRDYGIPCVVAGFEPIDILQSIYLILSQIKSGQAKVENEYNRAVTWEGNLKAQTLMAEVFKPESSNWRGIGKIEQSGLKIKGKYESFDVEKRYPVSIEKSRENPGCICGDILRGLKTPLDCRLFRKVCHPSHPVGACMVSAEGTCTAYYKYSSA